MMHKSRKIYNRELKRMLNKIYKKTGSSVKFVLYLVDEIKNTRNNYK